MRLAPALAIALALGGLGGPGYAGPADALGQKQRQLRHVREELQGQRDRLRSVKRQERRALADLEAMDQRLEAAERRLEGLEMALRQTRVRAQATAGSLAVVRARLNRQHALVAGRLRDMYKWGRRGYVDVLLDVTDFSEFVVRAHFLSTIMQADARLLAAYQADVQRYQALHAVLLAEQAAIGRLIDGTHQRRAEILEETKAKQALLARIQRERALFEQVVQDLERQDRDLIALIRRLQAAGRPAGVLRLPGRFRSFVWPARGAFTSGFGVRRHPIFRVRRMHSGVDIAARHGDPVVAALDGTVLYAGWFGGYGKIVLLDHGQGISTLYAHLSAILVREGQRVRQGQVIGRVGSTGYSTGPHVHFEVRINGTPVNPLAR